jgi:hypothetical protein
MHQINSYRSKRGKDDKPLPVVFEKHISHKKKLGGAADEKIGKLSNSKLVSHVIKNSDTYKVRYNRVIGI